MEVKENIDALLLDGGISFSEKEEIASHLEACVSCRQEFKDFQAISKTIKQTFPIAAPAFLDDKVFNAFQNHHHKKDISEVATIGWFGIPKLAYATAFLLLALFSGFAFQLGRMSANGQTESISSSFKDIQNVVREDFNEKSTLDKNDKQFVETKIVEVPVIKEKIIKVPVIKEKIITRTVYLTRDSSSKLAKKNNNLTLNNSIKDGEFLTQTNLKGFQPVAEIKPKVSKEEE
jgi:hypothetical protein